MRFWNMFSGIAKRRNWQVSSVTHLVLDAKFCLCQIYKSKLKSGSRILLWSGKSWSMFNVAPKMLTVLSLPKLTPPSILFVKWAKDEVHSWESLVGVNLPLVILISKSCLFTLTSLSVFRGRSRAGDSHPLLRTHDFICSVEKNQDLPLFVTRWNPGSVFALSGESSSGSRVCATKSITLRPFKTNGNVSLPDPSF